MFCITTSSYLSSITFSCLIILIPHQINAMTCPCEIHRATAEGPGLCSVTDDPDSCLIVFDDVSDGRLEDIDRILHDQGSRIDARTLIEAMKEQTPRDYDMDLITFGLPAALGLSLVPAHSYLLDDVANFVQLHGEYIYTHFTAPPSQELGVIKFENEEAIISHACFEYHNFQSQVLAMVKTDSSPLVGFCDGRSR